MDLIYFKGVVNSSGNSISRGNPSLHPHHQINNSHQIHYSASQDVYSNSAATPGSAGKIITFFSIIDMNIWQTNQFSKFIF